MHIKINFRILRAIINGEKVEKMFIIKLVNIFRNLTN